MGRTIHFTIQFPKAFTKKEVQILKDVSEKYNSGEFEHVWTCENFYIEPIQYAPNYANFNKSKTSIKSFCKVQGNEFNSYLVLQALKEISLLIPTAKIKITDEGKYLITSNIILQNGLAYLDIKEDKKDYEYWKSIKLQDRIDNYINTRDELILEFHSSRKYPDFDEMGFITGRYGIQLEDICREIDIDDFLDYQCSEATLIGGFEGEYWNKDIDAEKSSYEMLAQIMKIINPDMEHQVQILKQV